MNDGPKRWAEARQRERPRRWEMQRSVLIQLRKDTTANIFIMTTTTAARALLACLLLLPTPTTTTSLPTSTSWSSSSSRRRRRSVRTVEYAGGHPFDASSWEKEEVVDDRNVDVHFVDERWPTSSSPIASAPPPPPPPSTSSGGAVTTTSPPPTTSPTTSLYRPMRIVVDGRGLVPLATNDPSGY